MLKKLIIAITAVLVLLGGLLALLLFTGSGSFGELFDKLFNDGFAKERERSVEVAVEFDDYDGSYNKGLTPEVARVLRAYFTEYYEAVGGQSQESLKRFAELYNPHSHSRTPDIDSLREVVESRRAADSTFAACRVRVQVHSFSLATTDFAEITLSEFFAEALPPESGEDEPRYSDETETLRLFVIDKRQRGNWLIWQQELLK